jgi:hypothetical protein
MPLRLMSRRPWKAELGEKFIEFQHLLDTGKSVLGSGTSVRLDSRGHQLSFNDCRPVGKQVLNGDTERLRDERKFEWLETALAR